MKLYQRTVRNPIHASGVGLHSGATINLTINPAPPHTGIVFQRTDLDPPVTIQAKAENVGDTTLSTTLIKGEARIATIEHLLSACAGLGLDNLLIQTDGAEVPILDGSSSIFVFMLRSAGIIEQKEAEKRFILVKKTVEVSNGDKRARISPYAGFKISFSIDFDHPLINVENNALCIDFSSTTYMHEVARARTFGFERDIEYIKSNNYARGGSLDNVVYIDKEKVINKHGLRYKDELVKHKVLDAIGDLYLLGHNLLGSYEGHKSGHHLNNLLLRKLLQTESALEVIDASALVNPPIVFAPAINLEDSAS